MHCIVLALESVHSVVNKPIFVMTMQCGGLIQSAGCMRRSSLIGGRWILFWAFVSSAMHGHEVFRHNSFCTPVFTDVWNNVQCWSRLLEVPCAVRPAFLLPCPSLCSQARSVEENDQDRQLLPSFRDSTAFQVSKSVSC